MLPEDALCEAYRDHARPPVAAALPAASATLWVAAGSDALLAAAARAAGPGFFHHAGLGGDLDQPRCLLYRWLNALKQHSQSPEPVPETEAALRETLPNWLARAGARGPFTVTLVDLHRLRGPGFEAGLAWLPTYLPPGIRLQLGTAPGAVAETLRASPLWQVQAPALPGPGRPDLPTAPPALLARLWAARAGLPWSQWQAAVPATALPPGLVRVDERVLLLDPVLREQIAQRCLPDHGERQRLHQSLSDAAAAEADWAAALWHARQAQDAPRLAALLQRPALLAALDAPGLRFEAVQALELIGGEPAASGAALLAAGLSAAAPAEFAAAVLGAERLLALFDEALPAALLQQALATATPVQQVALYLRLARRAAAAPDLPGAARALAAAQERAAAEVLPGVLHQQALLAEQQEDLATAIDRYQTGLDALSAQQGEASPQRLPWLANLIAVLRRDHQLTRAQALAEQALALARRCHGVHPATAAALDQLAALHYGLGDHEGALALYEEALSQLEALFGPEHAATAAALHNLGTALDACGRYREAEARFRAALALRRRLHEWPHSDIASSLHNLAACLQAQQRWDLAREHYGEALDGWHQLYGEGHPAFVTTLNNLAEVLHADGDAAAAERLYRSCISQWQTLNGEAHPSTLGAITALARLYRERERPALAEPLLEHVLETVQAHYGRNDPLYLEALSPYAALLRDSGRGEAARACLMEVLGTAGEGLALLSPALLPLRQLLDSLDAEAPAPGSAT
jgi:hypothetical protein